MAIRDKMSHALFEMELLDREEEFYNPNDYNEEYGCYEQGESYTSQVSSVKKFRFRSVKKSRVSSVKKSIVYPEISDEELSRLMDEAEEWLRIQKSLEGDIDHRDMGLSATSQKE